MKRTAPLLLVLAWAVAGCSTDDADCDSVRCGCVVGSTVDVMIVGAADGTEVMADTLTCTLVSSGRSYCTNTTEPYPQAATITAVGYAPVTVMLTRASGSGGRCCPCEGTERWNGSATLVPVGGDSDAGGDGGPTCAPLGEACDVLPCCDSTNSCDGTPMMCNPGPGS